MMPWRLSKISGIVSLMVLVLSAVTVTGEEPLRFVHSGFQVEPRTDAPPTSVNVQDQAASQEIPPNPDVVRQKPSQPSLGVQLNTAVHFRERTSTEPVSARRVMSETSGGIVLAKNWTEEDRLAWRDHRGEGALVDTQLKPVVLNTIPLTEDEIKTKIIENNKREELRAGKDKRNRDYHQRWTDEEKREWLKRRQSENKGGWADDQSWPETPPWPDNQKFIVRQPDDDTKKKNVPSQSWREHRDKHRRQYQRGYSRYDREQRRYYYPPTYLGRTVVVLPSEFDPLSVRGQTYYYSGGIFYQRQADNFSNVPAPLGALVTKLPSEHVETFIKGVKYATANGVYYTKVTGGYEVAPPPEGFEGVIITNAPLTARGDAAVTVSIPDDDGQYADILLTRFGRGFHGPQGEYYTEFPPIKQLREMYL